MWQHLILENSAIRAGFLLVPVGLWISLFLAQKNSDRQNTGALLAFVWQFQASLLFAADFSGMYVEFLLGQAALLGATSYLVLMKQGFWSMLLLTFTLYVILGPSPGLHPISFLSHYMLIVLPGLALAVWTGDGTHLYLRSSLQTLCWACLLLWLFPSLMFFQTGASWQIAMMRPFWVNFIYVAPLLIPIGLLLGAVYQFAVEGNGTGFPYDPPEKLVTHGIYAYLSNPMQLGICSLMLWWGVVIGSGWVSLSGVVAAFLFVVFKDICNGSCAIGRTDPEWQIYQREVPKWLPRLKPWIRNASLR